MTTEDSPQHYSFSVDVVKWKEQPEYLGGAVPRPLLKNLPRLAQLPMPKKKKIRSVNEGAQNLAKVLCEGSFRCEVDIELDEILTITVFLDDKQDGQENEEGESGTKQTAVFRVQMTPPTIHMANVMIVSEGCIELIEHALTSETKHLLKLRTMHHLIRQHGALIPEQFITHACIALMEYYGSEFVLEGLDAATVLVDVLASKEQKPLLPTETTGQCGAALSRAGEALEAVGRFEDAAKVYEQALEYWSCFPHPSYPNAIQNAALAYSRGDMFKESEQLYVRAWYEFFKGSGKIYQKELINNICKMYHRFAVHPTGNGDKTILLLTILLDVAGIEPSSNGQYAETLLKPTYLSQKKSRQTLETAIQSPDVGHFRSTISKCFKKLAFTSTTIKPLPNEKVFDHSERVKDSKKAIKDRRLVDVDTCSNPACDELEIKDENAKFMRCPCKAVFYCGVKCQKADWPIHKTVCSYAFAKKQQKKKKCSPTNQTSA